MDRDFSKLEKSIGYEFKNKDSLAHEILSINHLSPEKDLEPGNHIIVPVYLPVDPAHFN